MIYVSVSYNYSPNFISPESWFKRTEGYAGILECLSKNNTVFNVKQINFEGERIHNGVNYKFVNFDKKETFFPVQLNRFVKDLNPDIVIVQGLHHPLQLIQLRMILPKKTKIIAQHHAEKPFAGAKKYVQRIADKFVDAYLFASHTLGLEWVENGNLASTKKIHEVMEVSSIFSPLDKNEAKLRTTAEGRPVFLWVGRLNANKDPINVIKAFLKFAKSYPEARLYMIYHTDELLNYIRKLLNTGDCPVKLIGQVPHSDLLYWFNSADYFISGSHYEGSGTAVCEAMSCGCVPVVTDIPSFRMITNNGQCGILYEPGSEAALLAALLQTKNLDLDEKRKNSFAHYHKKLSFEAIARQIESIVDLISGEQKKTYQPGTKYSPIDTL